MDPKHGSKLGFIDIQYQFVMVAAALAGGSVSNLEPGKAVLLAAKQAGARLYPTNQAFAQAMKTEEIGLGVMWKARGVTAECRHPAGDGGARRRHPDVRLRLLHPEECAEQGRRYAYMDAMLEKSAQEAFAVDMGFNPTVSNAVVAPDLHARIGFTPEEEKRLVDLDYAYMARENSAMKEWWDKVFKG